MAKILSINEVSFSASKNQELKAKKNKNISTPLSDTVSLHDYSMNNLKSRYMTNQIAFTGAKTSKLVEDFAFQELYENEVLGAVEIDSVIPTYKGNYYDKLADEALITIDREGSTIVFHEPGVNKDLLVESIKHNINENKYRGLGYGAENTNVITLNDIHGSATNIAF